MQFYIFQLESRNVLFTNALGYSGNCENMENNYQNNVDYARLWK